MTTQNYLSNVILGKVLSEAQEEERLALTRVLNADTSVALRPDELGKKMRRCAGHGVGNFIRGGEGVPYAELLNDAAGDLKVDKLKSIYSKIHGNLALCELDRLSNSDANSMDQALRLRLVDGYVDELERKLLAKLMSVAYEKATPAQRAEIDAKVANFAKSQGGKGISGLSTSAALLVIGNLGGFATYTLMSTVLSVVSVGTLGFGAYTLASSLLSVVLGPVGWLSLAAYGVFRFGSADEAKVVQLAATCAMTSQRLREKSRSGR